MDLAESSFTQEVARRPPVRSSCRSGSEMSRSTWTRQQFDHSVVLVHDGWWMFFTPWRRFHSFKDPYSKLSLCRTPESETHSKPIPKRSHWRGSRLVEFDGLNFVD